MKVKIDRKAWNKKVKKIRSLDGITIETGLFDSENARKGRLLDEGDPGNKQVARPWFSMNMHPRNKDLRYFVENSIRAIYAGKMTDKQFGKLLTEYCKEGLDDSSLADLKEITLLFKSGLLKRPETGRKRQSKGPAEDIGRDSGKMYRAIKSEVSRKGGKSAKKN